MNYRYNSPNLSGLIKVAVGFGAVSIPDNVARVIAKPATKSSTSEPAPKTAPAVQSAPIHAFNPASLASRVFGPPPEGLSSYILSGKKDTEPAPAPKPAPAPEVQPAPAPKPAPENPGIPNEQISGEAELNWQPTPAPAPTPAPTPEVQPAPESPGIPNEQISGEAELNWQPTPASTPAPAVSVLPASTAAQVDYSKLFGKNFNPGTSKADAWLKDQAEKLRKQNYSDAQISTMLSPSAYRRFGRKGQDYVVDTKRYRRPLGQ